MGKGKAGEDGGSQGLFQALGTSQSTGPQRTATGKAPGKRCSCSVFESATQLMGSLSTGAGWMIKGDPWVSGKD